MPDRDNIQENTVNEKLEKALKYYQSHGHYQDVDIDQFAGIIRNDAAEADNIRRGLSTDFKNVPTNISSFREALGIEPPEQIDIKSADEAIPEGVAAPQPEEIGPQLPPKRSMEEIVEQFPGIDMGLVEAKAYDLKRKKFLRNNPRDNFREQLGRIDKKAYELGVDRKEYISSIKNLQADLFLDESTKLEYETNKEIENLKTRTGALQEQNASDQLLNTMQGKLNSLESKREELLSKRYAETDRRIDEIEKTLHDGFMTEDVNPAGAFMPGVPLQGSKRKLTQEERDDMRVELKELKQKKQFLFKPYNEQVKDAIITNRDAIEQQVEEGLIPQDASPKEVFDLYYNGLYNEWKELKDDLGVEDANIFEKIAGRAKFVMSDVFGVESMEDPDFNRFAELDQKLKELAPIYFVNRSPLETDDQTFLEVMGKATMKQISPKLQRLTFPMATQVARDLDETLAVLGVKKGLEEGQKEEIEEATTLPSLGTLDFAEMAGTSAGFMVQFIGGSAIANSALRATKFGRAFLQLAEKGKLMTAANKYLSKLPEGKITKFFTGALKRGIEFETTGRVFQNAQEEANFMSGAAGYVIGVPAGKAFRLFGNKAPQIINRIKELAGLGVGEIGEEFGQEAVQAFQSQETIEEGFSELERRFGTLDKTARFVISAGVLGMAFHGGSKIGSGIAKSFDSKYKELSEQQKEKVDQVIAEMKADQDAAATEAIEETDPQSAKDIGKELTEEQQKPKYFIDDKEVSKEEFQKQVDDPQFQEKVRQGDASVRVDNDSEIADNVQNLIYGDKSTKDIIEDAIKEEGATPEPELPIEPTEEQVKEGQVIGEETDINQVDEGTRVVFKGKEGNFVRPEDKSFVFRADDGTETKIADTGGEGTLKSFNISLPAETTTETKKEAEAEPQQQTDTQQFNEFEKIVRESETLDEAFEKSKQLKNVPPEVSQAFRNEFDPDQELTPKQTFEKFYNKVKDVTAEPASETGQAEDVEILREDIDAALAETDKYIKTSKTRRVPQGGGGFIEKPKTVRLRGESRDNLASAIEEVVSNPNKANYDKYFEVFSDIYESPFTGSRQVKKLWDGLKQTFPEIEQARTTAPKVEKEQPTGKVAQEAETPVTQEQFEQRIQDISEGKVSVDKVPDTRKQIRQSDLEEDVKEQLVEDLGTVEAKRKEAINKKKAKKAQGLSGLTDQINEASKESGDVIHQSPTTGVLFLNLSPKKLKTKIVEEQKSDLHEKIKMPTEESEKRFMDADISSAKKPKNIFSNIKNDISDFLENFRRRYKHLNPRLYADVANKLRVFESSRAWTNHKANQYVKALVAPLSVNQQELLKRVIILEDISHSIDKGLETSNLPFGLKPDQIKSTIKDLKKVMEGEPKVKKAYDLRESYMKNQYNSLVENKIIPEQEGGYKTYYHRRMIDFIADANQETIMRGKKLTKSTKDFMKARAGAKGLDFSTNFIETEFKVVSDALYELRKKEIFDQITEPYKESFSNIKKQANQKYNNELKKVKKLFGEDSKEVKAFESDKSRFVNNEIEKLIPEGFVVWKADSNSLFRNKMVTEAQIEKSIDELKNTSEKGAEASINIMEKLIGDASELLIKGKPATYLLPKEIADTFDELSKPTKESFPIEKFIKSITSRWKIFVLLNPRRFLKYNLNNFFGDIDGVLAADPSILKGHNRAISELYDLYHKGKSSKSLDEAIEQGVVDSGFNIQEFSDLEKQDWVKYFTDRKPAYIKDIANKSSLEQLFAGEINPIRKYYDFIKKYTSFRENILRYSAYLRAKELLSEGKDIRWASDPKKLAQIENINEKAGKLARELLGDYGNISLNGQYIRQHLMPFYSWQEVNMGRYFRLIKNSADPETRNRLIGSLMRRGVTKAAATVIINYARLGIFTFAVNAWNRLMFPEEEEELRKNDTRGMQVILYRQDDGKIVTLPIVGAFADFLDFFGIRESSDNVWDLIIGEGNKAEEAKEAVSDIVYAPINRVAQGFNPFIKGTAELITGKQLYPDVRDPRPIYDKWEYIARFFSATEVYDLIKDRPIREQNVVVKFLKNSLIKEIDPKEQAYYSVRNDIRKKKNLGGFASDDPKSEALYKFKQSIRYNDLEKANKFLTEYYELGGTREGFIRSLKNKHPLSNLNAAERNEINKILKGRLNPENAQSEYGKSLTKSDISRIKSAVEYYELTFSTENPLLKKIKSKK